MSRKSVYTTNSSLPGWYSHRSRILVDSDAALELYCSSALTNARGLRVNVARLVTSAVVNRPDGTPTRLISTLGSTDNWGERPIRPRLKPTPVLVPPKKLPCHAEKLPEIRRCAPKLYDARVSVNVYPATGMTTPVAMSNGSARNS